VGLIGTRYILPRSVSAALEHVFSEPVDGVIVIENSLYARAHLGMSATTRANRILLATGGAQFVANPGLLLHEYYHVIRQWRPGYLTRWRYLLESARHGYWANCYESEAREFAAAAEQGYRRYMQELPQ
jgi:hypothetical protein